MFYMAAIRLRKGGVELHPSMAIGCSSPFVLRDNGTGIMTESISYPVAATNDATRPTLAATGMGVITVDSAL